MLLISSLILSVSIGFDLLFKRWTTIKVGGVLLIIVGTTALSFIILSYIA